jgi:hypothetical protein
MNETLNIAHDERTTDGVARCGSVGSITVHGPRDQGVRTHGPTPHMVLRDPMLSTTERHGHERANGIDDHATTVGSTGRTPAPRVDTTIHNIALRPSTESGRHPQALWTRRRRRTSTEFGSPSVRPSRRRGDPPRIPRTEPRTSIGCHGPPGPGGGSSRHPTRPRRGPSIAGRGSGDARSEGSDHRPLGARGASGR